jgi:hypothetical protein
MGGIEIAASSNTSMAKLFPLHVKRPERICWGCARLCPAADMACGNGKDRTEHPSELFGDDWFESGLGSEPLDAVAADGGPAAEMNDVEGACTRVSVLP